MNEHEDLDARTQTGSAVDNLTASTAQQRVTLPCICQGCGQPMRWTSLYGDWCAVCKPRNL